ncbi:unnamed protein product [Didymodactylos carnosus]|nr:unnamed protein product [Didymodactylos carnosus]CAF3850463.1 unnamed protein product [Didymodactylos carnosus]
MLKSAPPTPSTKRGRPSLDSTSNENNQTTTSRAVPNSIPPSSVRLDKSSLAYSYFKRSLSKFWLYWLYKNLLFEMPTTSMLG